MAAAKSGCTTILSAAMATGRNSRQGRDRCFASASMSSQQIIAHEAAKPIKTAQVEADRAAGTFTFAAIEARKLAGEVIPIAAAPGGDTKVAYTMRVPIGVVGAISPFNFPLNLVAHKLAPAIAAGCPVVLKPAAKPLQRDCSRVDVA